jgi:DNA-binding protein
MKRTMALIPRLLAQYDGVGIISEELILVYKIKRDINERDYSVIRNGAIVAEFYVSLGYNGIEGWHSDDIAVYTTTDFECDLYLCWIPDKMDERTERVIIDLSYNNKGCCGGGKTSKGVNNKYRGVYTTEFGGTIYTAANLTGSLNTFVYNRENGESIRNTDYRGRDISGWEGCLGSYALEVREYESGYKVIRFLVDGKKSEIKYEGIITEDKVIISAIGKGSSWEVDVPEGVGRVKFVNKVQMERVDCHSIIRTDEIYDKRITKVQWIKKE